MENGSSPDPVEQARRAELERALRRIAHGEEPQRVMDEMSRRLANKLLHDLTVRVGVPA
ncbi:MAG TPA: hypothetical protein VK043_12660 [Burkholderiales bacterium]|nr:hypothetical protein [Burkholderiales bacterium]